MRDGIERSERRERKRQRRWEVHGRSLQHVLNAVRKRAEAPDEAERRRRRRRRRS